MRSELHVEDQRWEQPEEREGRENEAEEVKEDPSPACPVSNHSKNIHQYLLHPATTIQHNLAKSELSGRGGKSCLVKKNLFVSC